MTPRFVIRHKPTGVLKWPRREEDEAMIDRRTLLRSLFSLGGLAVLLTACKHRPGYGQKEEPGSQGGTGGSY